jgi:hypothetical protein
MNRFPIAKSPLRRVSDERETINPKVTAGRFPGGGR